MLQRKHFKTDPTQHFLKYNPINSPRICVAIAAYNEQDSIEQTVKDFIKYRDVESVIVVDNNPPSEPLNTISIPTVAQTNNEVINFISRVTFHNMP